MNWRASSGAVVLQIRPIFSRQLIIAFNH